MKKMLALAIILLHFTLNSMRTEVVGCELPRECPIKKITDQSVLKKLAEDEINSFLKSANPQEIDELGLYLKYCPTEFMDVDASEKMPEDLRPTSYIIYPAKSLVAKTYDNIKCLGNNFYGANMYVIVNGKRILSSINKFGIEYYNYLLDYYNKNLISRKGKDN